MTNRMRPSLHLTEKFRIALLGVAFAGACADGPAAAAHPPGAIAAPTKISAFMNEQTRTAPEGSWGGNGISVAIKRDKTSIEYPCAEGEILGPIKLDRNGKFSVAGFHTVASPGPLRKDAQPRKLAARFEGRIVEKTMFLRVILTATKEVLGDFELKKDAPARIKRCM